MRVFFVAILIIQFSGCSKNSESERDKSGSSNASGQPTLGTQPPAVKQPPSAADPTCKLGEPRVAPKYSKGFVGAEQRECLVSRADVDQCGQQIRYNHCDRVFPPGHFENREKGFTEKCAATGGMTTSCISDCDPQFVCSIPFS